MISPWTEVDLDLFYEVLRKYLNHVKNSDDKVIEIQNPSDSYFDPPIKTRIFLGAKINPFDWPDWNERLIGVINEMGLDFFKSKCDLLFCSLGYGGGPMMSPIPKSGRTLEMFLATSFGDKNSVESFWKGQSHLASSLVFWYSRNSEGKIVLDVSRNTITLPDTQRYIRIRIIDYPDWKKLVDDTVRATIPPEEITKDDLKPEDFGEVITH